MVRPLNCELARHTLHFTLSHYKKIAPKCDFSCISPKIIVPLRRKGHLTTITVAHRRKIGGHTLKGVY